jgi:putative transposase
MKVFYRGRLPHLQPPEGTFFVTYRLADSIPMKIIKEYKMLPKRKAILRNLNTRRSWVFRRLDRYMDSNPNGPYWLANEEIAKLVKDSLLFNHKVHYELHAYCIMSNHVHILFTALKGAPQLFRLMQSHKSFTGRMANRLLERSGKFWELESYDVLIRDDKHFENVLRYIINNPVKAGLVTNYLDWPHTWISPGLLGLE